VGSWRYTDPVSSGRRFSVGPLLDLQSYREIRLRALQANPEVFCSTYAREAAWTAEQWRERYEDPGCGIFGVYDETGRLVGMTGVYRSGESGILWGSWLEPEARGLGASELMYRARLDWARHQGLRRVLVSHRQSNEASRRANQRHGFVRTGAEPRVWPDGATELEVLYELVL
jgi:RimJ/RimL family protein N-acetyltransferase